MKKIFTILCIIYAFLSTAANAQGIYQLYGSTGYGGPDDRGTIFTTKYDGTGHSVKKLFSIENQGVASPNNSPVAFNGKLYSVLDYGGLNDDGIISEYNPATGVYTKKADLFTIGEKGSEAGMVVYNNKLYGTTYTSSPSVTGAIFEFNPADGSITKLQEFDMLTGHGSMGTLTLFNNKFYGITAFGGANNDGTIFEFDPATNVLTKKRDLLDNLTGFGTRGGFAVYNNKLWAVSSNSAGPLKGGFIFSYDPVTNLVASKMELGSISADFHYGTLAVLNNKLYGVAIDKIGVNGSVLFQYDPAQDMLTRERSLPEATGAGTTSLLVYNNLLYGTPAYGNINGDGVIFTYDPLNNIYNTKVILDEAMGGHPTGVLTLYNNKMYGFTRTGTYGIAGGLFEYNPANNTYLKKVELGNEEITRPNGGMTLYNHKLYGVAGFGGKSGQGGIFSFDPATYSYEELYKFQNLDGTASEQGGLTLYNNKFYGVTNWGGLNEQGVLFTFDPATNVYTKLFDFGGTNGERPIGMLLEYSGKLYGTCSQGGNNTNGTIFEYNPITNQVSIKVIFDGVRGKHPNSGLILHDGRIFGTAVSGGTNGDGTLFEYLPQANGLIKLADFEKSVTGNAPYGGMVAYNNKLYGMTANGEPNYYAGKIYEFNIASAVLTPKVTLTATGGQHGISRMTVVGNKLMGMTNIGGDYEYGGVVFEYDPETNNYIDKTNFTVANGRLPRNSELIKLPARTAPGLRFTCQITQGININAANANEWIQFTDEEGRAVAEINANGNILGMTSVGYYTHDGATRQTAGGIFYLDRNITILRANQPITPVSVRLYIRKEEFDKFKATAGVNVNTPADLTVFNNTDECTPTMDNATITIPATQDGWNIDYVYSADVLNLTTSYYFGKAGAILPVKLLSFTGKKETNCNKLVWQASCTEETLFSLEKSVDGVNFTAVHNLNAAPQNGSKPFTYNDCNITAGKTFYRLLMKENNSAGVYSNQIVIDRNNMVENVVEIIPNPVVGNSAQVRIATTKSTEGTMSVVDVAGKKMLEKKVKLNVGINNIELNVSNFAAGIYFIFYNDGLKKQTIKMVKQ